MRTVFDIVLGIFVTVLKACLHALISTAGLGALAAAAVLAGVYIGRRIARSRPRPAKTAEVICINR